MNNDHTLRGRLRRRARLATGIVAAGALMLTACAADAPANDPDGASPRPDRITIATPTAPGNPAGVPIWIGALNGFFEEENLEIEVVTFPGRPSDAVATVVSGQADLVIAVPDAIIAPTANGDDLNLSWIFTPYQRPSFVIAVPADSPVDTADGLEGLKVALPSLGAPYETFLRTNVSEAGGDPDAVDVVAVAANAALEVLRNGDVDAVVLNRGDLAHAVEVTGFQVDPLPLAGRVSESIAAGFMMRADSSEEERAIYERYLRAYVKSAVFAQENPEAAIELSWTIYPETRPADESDVPALVAMLKATVDEFVPADNGEWGYISEERWRNYVANLGFGDQIPDVTVLYDYSLLPGISNFDEEEVREQAAVFVR